MKTKQKWEIEFDKVCEEIPMGDGITMRNDYTHYGKEQIKAFIHKTLQEEREEMVGEIRNMKVDISSAIKDIEPFRQIEVAMKMTIQNSIIQDIMNKLSDR